MKKSFYTLIIVILFSLKVFPLELTIRNSTGRTTFVSVRQRGRRIFSGKVATNSPVILNVSPGEVAIEYFGKNGKRTLIRRRAFGHFVLIVLR